MKIVCQICGCEAHCAKEPINGREAWGPHVFVCVCVCVFVPWTGFVYSMHHHHFVYHVYHYVYHYVHHYVYYYVYHYVNMYHVCASSSFCVSLCVYHVCASSLLCVSLCVSLCVYHVCASSLLCVLCVSLSVLYASSLNCSKSSQVRGHTHINTQMRVTCCKGRLIIAAKKMH